MATKPVISIDVDDSKFQKFHELFNEYNAALGEQPAAWNAINDASASAGEALKFGAMSGRDALSEAANEAGKVTKHLQSATKAELMLSKATKAHTRGFADMGRAGSDAWKAIGGAADASITKTASGLTGMLSLLGPIGVGVATVVGAAVAGVTAAKALADAAVTRQRSAFGLGTTAGRQAAFGVYGQQFFGDGQSALQSAANAQSNFGNAGALGALGIDFNKARGMSKSDLAFEMLKSGVRIANASPDLPLGNNPLLAQYAALTGDKDFDQLRNAMAMGPEALNKAQSETNRNTGRMDLDRGAVANAALLKKSVEGAGVTAQSWLINNTSGVDPKIAKGIDALSGDPRAQADVKGALDRVGTTIDNKAVPALQHFTHALNEASGGSLHNAKSALNGVSGWFNEKTRGWGTRGDMMIGPGGKLIPVPGKGGASSGGRDAAAAALGSIEGTYSSVNSDSGALGRWQFMPGTADSHLSAAWKKKYGSTSTPGGKAAFLGSPEAQNDAFTSYYDELYDHASKRTKDPAQIQRMIALGWYGGEGSWNETQAQLNAPQTYGGNSYPSQNSYADKYMKLINQMRNTRPPTVNVNVSNPTQSRVGVSVKGANP